MTERDISGRIGQLFIHPIKSCAGIEVKEALLTPTGLKYDRHWMLINNAGHFLTQREFPHMALIKPSLTETHLVVDAPGMSPFQIPLDETGDLLTVQIWSSTVSAFDMGEVANAWFSQVVGVAVKLVRFNADEPRACSTKWTDGDDATTEFADGYPLLITTRAAIDELNEKLLSKDFSAVDQRRFRPNIVLDDLSAHDEDLLEIIYIDADEPVQIKNVKPCARCPIPSIDPDTGNYEPEAVGDTIQTYRQDARLDGAVTFGMNAIVLQGAGQMLRVGQTIAADYAF